jgi:hypothetical protein
MFLAREYIFFEVVNRMFLARACLVTVRLSSVYFPQNVTNPFHPSHPY